MGFWDSYVGRVIISLDQLGNTLIPGGKPDETLSSRMGRALRGGKPNKITKITCDVLDVVDKDHCVDSIEFTPDGKPDPHHLGDEK